MHIYSPVLYITIMYSTLNHADIIVQSKQTMSWDMSNVPHLKFMASVMFMFVNQPLIFFFPSLLLNHISERGMSQTTNQGKPCIEILSQNTCQSFTSLNKSLSKDLINLLMLAQKIKIKINLLVEKL